MALDRLVVARGAASGLILAAPAAIANGIIAAQDEPPEGLLALTFLVIVLGFLLAGLVAAREAAADPKRHGLIATAAAFVPVELLLVLGRLDRGKAVSIPSILLLAAFAAAAGNFGAHNGALLRDRRLSKEQGS